MSYNPEYYIHDLDRKAFDALNKFPAIVRLQEEYLAIFKLNIKTVKSDLQTSR